MSRCAVEGGAFQQVIPAGAFEQFGLAGTYVRAVGRPVGEEAFGSQAALDGAADAGRRTETIEPKGTTLKITKVEPILGGPWLFLHVHTDEGIVGLGEAGLWGYPEASLAVLEQWKDYLIGQDPLKIEHHFQYMEERSIRFDFGNPFTWASFRTTR